MPSEPLPASCRSTEGLVAGYTGPGGKTILPHRVAAKLDPRLVPDMTNAESLAALKRTWPNADLATSRSI
jgi:hypothetical protein